MSTRPGTTPTSAATPAPTTAPELHRHLSDADLTAALHVDARAGLTATPKTLPPTYFYDARGSALFEDITRLPEYYPTRCERALLAAHAGDVAALSGADALVELGSGSSEKTRLLLDALAGAGTLRRYVPVDVSAAALEQAIPPLTADYPGVAVEGVVADLGRHLALLPVQGRRLVAFLGGTIGNLDPEQRASFLTAVAGWLSPGDGLLLGADLVKDAGRLVRAYDDAAGVTADFNRNVLRVLVRELGATCDPESFAHVAVWDAERSWVEMRLRTPHPQVVDLPVLGISVDLAEGEEIRTEISAKFTPDGVTAELAAAGFAVVGQWTGGDPDGEDPAAPDYALTLARVG